jgi:hypothetical protein
LGKLLLGVSLSLSVILTACGSETLSASSDSASTNATSSIIPNSSASWFLQLQGDIDLEKDVDLYEVDLFDTPSENITYLKSRGVTVICYFSAGSYEDWREDAEDFSDADLGNALDGWPGESWLDITSENVKAIMAERIKLAASKGCDGVDPDNVDGYTNQTGLSFTADDQLNYNRFLAETAHNAGLIIGLKNDLNQIASLEPYFDFAINEQCMYYDECSLISPFMDSNKLIINLEYDTDFISDESEKSALCSKADSYGMMTQVQTLDLDGTVLYSCF